MNNDNFPEFSPERESITQTFNQMLNQSTFAPLEKLPPYLEEILYPYPQSAAMLKKYYNYQKFPKEYLVYTMTIYFDDHKVFRWIMGIQLSLPDPNLQPKLLRIDVMEQLALLVYKGEIIFDRISEVEINSVVSALNNWYEQNSFKPTFHTSNYNKPESSQE